jgi:hypothetical protein
LYFGVFDSLLHVVVIHGNDFSEQLKLSDIYACHKFVSIGVDEFLFVGVTYSLVNNFILGFMFIIISLLLVAMYFNFISLAL